MLSSPAPDDRLGRIDGDDDGRLSHIAEANDATDPRGRVTPRSRSARLFTRLDEQAAPPSDTVSQGMSGHPVLHIAAAILRREDHIVLIRQTAPGEEPFWSVPSGRVEDRELVTEGLVREVFEETGLQVVDPGRLAFVLQIDNRRSEQLHKGRGPGGGYHATVWTFEIDSWTGQLEPRDPDGFVVAARFAPIPDAIAHLGKLEWQSVTVDYLRGKIETGSLHLQRWHGDGSVEVVA